MQELRLEEVKNSLVSHVQGESMRDQRRGEECGVLAGGYIYLMADCASN